MPLLRVTTAHSDIRPVLLPVFYLRIEASLRAGLETVTLHFFFFRKVQKFLGAEDTVLCTSAVTTFLGAEDQLFLCPQK